MLQVFADRGGTFTDLVALTDRPDVAQRAQGSSRFQVTPLVDGRWILVYKLLSEQPDRYGDAVVQGIRDILGLAPGEPLPPGELVGVRMGTTVATNALLERKGEPTLLVTTAGFEDGLRIGYQNRPDIFARQIQLPELLYQRVIGVAERHSASGEVIVPLTAAERQRVRGEMAAAYGAGLRACAIVLIHGDRYPDHELALAELAQSVGFPQVSVSHQVSPVVKWVSRGDTTVVDAYLSPILRRYVAQVSGALGGAAGPKLEFMKSDGGLTLADRFQGKDSILSGPAGGIVGAVKTSQAAGLGAIIGFDMGGTSTDVSHFNGEYERTFETTVAGVRLRAPMLAIHTVAAGGGSILHVDGGRYRVGPDSAGAYPGPACYRQGGPLTVTDCNVMVGKLQPDFFPQVFGPGGDQPLDRDGVVAQFEQWAAEMGAVTGERRPPAAIAAGFLAIAIDNMANAIKKISVQRGYDLAHYTLCCFGGAGGQHACALAEALGMTRIFLHPYAGVLSAYGIGLAEVRSLGQGTVNQPLTAETLPAIAPLLETLTQAQTAALQAQDVPPERITTLAKAHLRYDGSDVPLLVDWADLDTMVTAFQAQHQHRYGFTQPERGIVVESLSVEAVGQGEALDARPVFTPRPSPLTPVAQGQIYSGDRWHPTPIYQRTDLRPGDVLQGPALIVEATGTNVLEPGWVAQLTEADHLVLTQGPQNPSPTPPERGAGVEIPPSYRGSALNPLLGGVPAGRGGYGDGSAKLVDTVDPVRLEIFNNRFRAIAEEMGVTLQNTSHSVNIKERLDFSCALFDAAGNLVANAPHIPVHLGSMGASVRSLLAAQGDTLRPGDVYAANNPYNGGTHLPDITVITPVFAAMVGQGEAGTARPLFYLASRGHHADVGGITPGSMPPASRAIAQEGILLDNVRVVHQGEFCRDTLTALLQSGPYPARNPAQNLADLQAQIAANGRGVQELRQLVYQYGLATVQAYMGHVQANATAAVQRAIATLQDGHCTYPLDQGGQIQVRVTVDHPSQTAHLDFTGTSPQQANNFNAPLAITQAVVLYVFRTLLDEDIPLNQGCLAPLRLTVPAGCLLNPRPPAAVVAGNVETSQGIANALYEALGIMAHSQGTMNNLTFGNGQYQYYETLCGGSGAGPGFPGTDAVQTHMTNSRLTDPEILEIRYPVRVEEFSMRRGSGGVGQYPGGCGALRRLRFLEPMQAAILSSRRGVAPLGLAGGGPGQRGENWVERIDGGVEALGGCAEVAVAAGDVLAIATPGGGGYGVPTEEP